MLINTEVAHLFICKCTVFVFLNRMANILNNYIQVCCDYISIILSIIFTNYVNFFTIVFFSKIAHTRLCFILFYEIQIIIILHFMHWLILSVTLVIIFTVVYNQDSFEFMYRSICESRVIYLYKLLICNMVYNTSCVIYAQSLPCNEGILYCI